MICLPDTSVIGKYETVLFGNEIRKSSTSKLKQLFVLVIIFKQIL